MPPLTVIVINKKPHCADIVLPFLGSVHINAIDRELHPITPACSQNIFTALYSGFSDQMLEMLDEIETAASILFPGNSPWNWGVHGDCQYPDTVN